MNTIKTGGDLENLAKNCPILVDSSSVHPRQFNLCKNLYRFGGISEVSLSHIQEGFDIINFHENLLHSSKAIYIPEVISELKEYFNQLNGHYRFINNWKNGHPFHDSRKRKNKSKIIKKVEKIRFRLEINEEIFKEFGKYCDKLFHFLRKISHSNHELKFNEQQKRIYQEALTMARAFSKDLDRKYMNNKINYKNPNFIGAELETDKKLAATAFTLAYSDDVYVFSRDYVISEILLRMTERTEDKTKKSSLKTPPFKIVVR